MTKRYLVLLTSLAAGLSSPALAQKVGPEFQVNTYTLNWQHLPSVASDANGNPVIVWQSLNQDGSYEGVFGQRYDSNGNRVGGEFQINTYTTYGQEHPAIASDSNGDFVVVWDSFQDGYAAGVFGQRYDSSGSPRGSEFQVNTYTTEDQSMPSVASDANGNFVVVWNSDTQDGDKLGVFGQRYDNAGNHLGGEFQVNTYTTGKQYSSYSRQGSPLHAVASDSDGNFVVVWVDGSDLFPKEDGRDGSLTGIFGQRFDSGGNPLGGEFQVNTYTTGRQGNPSVASDPLGNFVVAWEDGEFLGDGQDGSDRGIFGRRYDRAGNALGGEFQINTYTKRAQWLGGVTSDVVGNFVVVWQSQDQDGSHYGVFAQRFDSGANRLRGEFRVNTYTPESQNSPSVSSDPAGNFVVVWTSHYQDGSLGGVFGQRFSAACEASVQVQGDVHAPGSMVPVRVHIAHRRPKTVTVPWELRLTDANGQRIVRRVTEPHTFEPGDVVDREVEFRLPDDLAAGTYTLELTISGMAGTHGAATTLRVVRSE